MNLREQYPAGTRFRVVREGARMVRRVPLQWPGAYTFESTELKVGDVVVCRGFGPGWGSDPGYGINWAGGDFYPQAGGPFTCRPADGYLERIEEEGDG